MIVQKSLPLETVAKHYREGSGCSEQVILNYVTYFEERITVGALAVSQIKQIIFPYDLLDCYMPGADDY